MAGSTFGKSDNLEVKILSIFVLSAKAMLSFGYRVSNSKLESGFTVILTLMVSISGYSTRNVSIPIRS